MLLTSILGLLRSPHPVPVRGASRDVCRYAERVAVAANDAGPVSAVGIFKVPAGGDGLRRRRNGRVAQVHVRAAACTNGTSVGTSDAFWDMEQADQIHRVRSAGVKTTVHRCDLVLGVPEVSGAPRLRAATTPCVPHALTGVLRTRFGATV